MFVAIEGATGAGKTTLANAMYKYVGGASKARLLLDPFEDNPFLHRQTSHYVSGGTDGIALVTEMTFLALRIASVREARFHMHARDFVIADWAMLKQKVFASVTLPQDDFVRMCATIDLWARDLPRPDVVVYLNADVNTLRFRVAQRGRELESSLPDAYFAKLLSAYDLWIEDGNCALIRRETSDFDSARVSDLEYLVLEIQHAVRHSDRTGIGW